MRLLTEGFETRDTSQFWETRAFKGYGTGRLGGYSLGSYGVTYRLSENEEFYTRYAYESDYFSGERQRFAVRDASGAVVLRLNWSLPPSVPVFKVFTGTSNVPVINQAIVMPNRWHVIEFHYRYSEVVNTASPNIEMRINGLTVFSYTGATKAPINPGDNPRPLLGFIDYDTYVGGLDDMAINDTTGGVDNSWCGDGHVALLQPNADITAAFTGSDGNSTNNYQLIAVPTNIKYPAANDTTYVESEVSGTTDWYATVPVTLRPADQIRRFLVWAHARETLANSDNLAIGLRLGSGGSAVWRNVQLKADWFGYTAEVPLSGATNTLDNVQVGVRVP